MTDAVWMNVRQDAIDVAVLVVPRASRSRVVGVHDGMLRIQLAAPPVDGAANEALLKLIAELVGTPMSSVALARGQSSRRKTVRITGADAATVQRTLEVA